MRKEKKAIYIRTKHGFYLMAADVADYVLEAFEFK